jgi:chromosome segregation ATPase
MADLHLKSPTKGLEKLALELRQERQKCTNALQDRSKQKIEIEKLKQTISQCNEELQQSEDHNRRLMENFSEAEKRIYDVESKLQSREDDYKNLLQRNAKTEEELTSTLEELHNQSDLMKSSRLGQKSLNTQTDELEARIESKNSVIRELELEIQHLKRFQDSQENKIKGYLLELERKNLEIDDFKFQNSKLDTVTTSFSDLQRASEGVREELERALTKNSELSAKLRESVEYGRYVSESLLNLSSIDVGAWRYLSSPSS